MMPTHRRPPRAFTITELLVVIGILTILIGMLMPVLGRTLRGSAKSRDLYRVRQVGIAWSLYANDHDDGVLPGYLATEVQKAWSVGYRYPDGSPIPPRPDYPTEGLGQGETNVAGPWPWRLMSYLDYTDDIVLGHREPEGSPLEAIQRAWEIREKPAFGYNAIFVGGWWYGARSTWFGQARIRDPLDDSRRAVTVVSRAVSSIRRPSELITFSSSAEREPGVHKYDPRRDDRDGSFVVLAPIFGSHRVWGRPEDPDLVSLDTIQIGSHEGWFDETAPFG